MEFLSSGEINLLIMIFVNLMDGKYEWRLLIWFCYVIWLIYFVGIVWVCFVDVW